jgi:hypothetical protein
MHIEQRRWTPAAGWAPTRHTRPPRAQLVFVFGATDRLRDSTALVDLSAIYPGARLFGCSTSGEIAGAQVYDDSIVATAVTFEYTTVALVSTPIADEEDSDRAGRRLAAQLPRENLAHVFVLSDGLKVNAGRLVHGLTADLPEAVAVTGGLAGDGTRFRETVVVSGGPPVSGIAAAVGFYSSRLKVGCASLGGWDPFGPERVITKARGNVLLELDGQSALGLYKRYLGDHARDLPASGLLFPLSVRLEDGAATVRTILGIDEAAQSMTFGGDMTVGARARLMKANVDRLIDGATGAAQTSTSAMGADPPDLALLISCFGRKLVLKQRTEEEVEAVRDVLGPATLLAGFYSYGELCPFTPNARCQLHNQTMTVTTLSER